MKAFGCCVSYLKDYSKDTLRTAMAHIRWHQVASFSNCSHLPKHHLVEDVAKQQHEVCGAVFVFRLQHEALEIIP